MKNRDSFDFNQDLLEKLTEEQRKEFRKFQEERKLKSEKKSNFYSEELRIKNLAKWSEKERNKKLKKEATEYSPSNIPSKILEQVSDTVSREVKRNILYSGKVLFDTNFSILDSADINPEDFELKELLKYCKKILVAEKSDGRSKYWIQPEGIDKDIAEIFGIDPRKITVMGEDVKEEKLEWGFWED